MKMTLDKYLYLKGYKTKDSSRHKLKRQRGIAKAFYELFYKNLENGDVIELQRLVNEFRGLK